MARVLFKSSYNFTTSASQAYGGNQVELAPGIFALYSGDVVKDATVALKMEEEMKERLIKESNKLGMNPSTLIRVLIVKYFEKGDL